MDRPTTSHPSELALARYRAGRLDRVQAKEVERHLATCAGCSGKSLPNPEGPSLGPDSQPGSASDFGIDSLVTRPGLREATSSPTPTPTPPLSDPHLPPELAQHPHYTDIRKLGSGGMGVVYRAHNTIMGRTEAFKVVGRHLLERAGVFERFQREIRSAARLNHPNIVTAYSASLVGESLVLTMEYVDGMDLARLVKAKGPLPVQHACYFIYQAALGLQHAHDRDTVHRDIKPANLMLARDGKRSVIKILDFGLAKASREGPREDDLTGVGQSLGTPSYMAPEQILDARSADIRADIYSLGCTLYHLLTGAPPFQGDSLYELYRAHHESLPRRLDALRADVPPALAEVVDRMLAKEPADRYQTPAQVARALTPFFKLEKKGRDVPAGSIPPEDPALAVDVPTELEPPALPSRPEPGSKWTSLIEFEKTEKDESLSRGAPARRETRGLPVVPIFLVLLGLAVGGLWRSGVLSRTTRNDDARTPDQAGTEKPAPARPEPAPTAFALFNGRNLEGWVGFSNGYQVQPDEVATVRDGQIVLSPGVVRGGLRSARKFQDFRLSFEYLFPTGGRLTVPGSGVAILPLSEDGLRFDRGVECQVCPNETGDVYGFPPDPTLRNAERRPEGVRLVRGSLRNERPIGQWNAMRIHYLRNEITIELNGEEVNRVECTAPVSGWLCLMNQGSDVHFRNFVIEETLPTGTNPTSDSERFVPLFNGMNLNGWRTDAAQPGNWRVVDGVLTGSGSELSHLYTERDDYRDFHLRAEARVNEEGNSGVHFRASSSPTLPQNNPKFPGGYEAQIYGGTDGPWLTGCLYRDLSLEVLVPQTDRSSPSGRWFTLEVIAEGSRIIVKVDGKTTADYEDRAQTRRTGAIALQQKDEVTVVEFRKIEIRER